MSRVFSVFLLLAGCATSAPAASIPAASAPAPQASAPPPVRAEAKPAFRCTEVIGLTITAEWYAAGFEQLVDDARFQARTRPHTFVDQWADPAHEAWAEPVTSPCAEQPENPDRVVLFAANWKLTTPDEWETVLSQAVSTLRTRYSALRDLELYTVLRGPQNQSCGDPKSIVEPMIDDAITRVAAKDPTLVHAAPRLEAPDCTVFEKGGPHFTEAGQGVVAKLMAEALR